jgi:hypothetical protein
MKKKLPLIIVIILCALFVACEEPSEDEYYSKPLSTTKENTLPVDNEINQAGDSNQQNDKDVLSENSAAENNTDTDSADDAELPEYIPSDKESDDIGSITVDFNGKSKTYKALLEFDDSIGSEGTWVDIFGNSDQIYIQLPSDVETGDEFTVEDGTMSVNSFGPPAFSFVYTDKSGNDYAIYDVNNIYDSFGLIIDKWDGRGGYAEGRFAAEIRPLVGDSIIMKDGRFKVKIRN